MAEKSSVASNDRLIIRPYSDIIYMYPTMLLAVVCGLWVQMGGLTPADPGEAGIVFTLMFFFNLTIVGFDYTRLATIVILLIVVILGLLTILQPWVGGALAAIFDQSIFMNATFYWVYAVVMFVVLAVVWIKARFDYWEIKNMELLHHHGLLGDTERWPAPNMRISKEIPDVMEFLLFRSGRLVLMPAREPRAIVIANVPNIRKVEVRMQELLNTLRVADGDG